MHIPTLDIMLTGKCNLNCSYCFLRKWEQEKRNFNVEKEIIDGIINNEYTRGFFLFGGEPLMQIDEILEIIDGIKKSDKIDHFQKNKMLNDMSNIITNGTLIRKNIDKLKQIPNLHLQVSFDGTEEIINENRNYHNGNHAFNEIVDGIECALENNINVSVHGVVQKNTITKFYDIIKALSDVTYYTKNDTIFQGNLFMIIFEEDYTDGDINEARKQWMKGLCYIYDTYGYEQMVKMTNKSGGDCGAGKSLFAITPDGTLYPCHRYPGNEHIKDIGVLGNIKQKYKHIPLHKKRMINMYTEFISKYHLFSTKQLSAKESYICPQTSIETTQNPGMVNPKYIKLMETINSASEYLIEIFKK